MKTYYIIPSPNDKLASPKELCVKGLFKRDYLGFHYATDGLMVPKKIEALFGYDVYHGYTCKQKGIGVVCPAVIVDENGNNTNWILKRILRTRRNKVKLYSIMYNVKYKTMKEEQVHLPTFMAKQKFWTDPRIPISFTIRQEMTK